MSSFPIRFSTSNAAPAEVEADWLVIGLPQNGNPSARISALDAATDGQLMCLLEADDLTGKPLELVPILNPKGLRAKRLLVVGLGPADKHSRATVHDAFAAAFRSVTGRKFGRVAVVLPEPAGDRKSTRLNSSHLGI